MKGKPETGRYDDNGKSRHGQPEISVTMFPGYMNRVATFFVGGF